MSYKYINPGYGGLFDSFSAAAGYTQESHATRSKTGVLFTTSESTATKNLPAGKEFWLKYDITITSGGTDGTILRFDSASSYCGFYARTNALSLYPVINGSQLSSAVYTMASNSLPETFLIHIVSNASSGVFEVWANGVKVYDYSGNILSGADIASFSFWCSSSKKHFSNIICSDTEIGQAENVLILPATISSTMTDNGDGTYTANNSGEYISQTVNSSSLTIPATSTIKGIAVAGVPAYYDGEGISQLAAKIDGTTVETLDLTTNSTLGVMYSTEVNETISELTAKTYTLEAV